MALILRTVEGTLVRISRKRQIKTLYWAERF